MFGVWRNGEGWCFCFDVMVYLSGTYWLNIEGFLLVYFSSYNLARATPFGMNYGP